MVAGGSIPILEDGEHDVECWESDWAVFKLAWGSPRLIRFPRFSDISQSVDVDFSNVGGGAFYIVFRSSERIPQELKSRIFVDGIICRKEQYNLVVSMGWKDSRLHLKLRSENVS